MEGIKISKKKEDCDNQIIRIYELLKKSMSKEEANSVLKEFIKLTKENDEIINKILTHPQVKIEYDTKNYDGFELKSYDQKRIHFIKDSNWVIANVSKYHDFPANFKNPDGTYKSNSHLQLFRENIDINKLRLEQLVERGSLLVIDPSKVKIVKKH